MGVNRGSGPGTPGRPPGYLFRPYRGDEDHGAEVEELSVRAESRRLGLGRAPLLDGLRSLREHGAETARLYTGTENPHRSYDLYESVGFRRQNEYVRYRKPVGA